MRATSIKKKLWLFASMMFLLTGCGAAEPRAAKSPEPSQQAPATAVEAAPQPGAQFGAESGGFPAGDAPATNAPPAPPPATATPKAPSAQGGARAEDKSASREPSPESRPGLGTEWGETRTSHVHDVTFVRDSSRPFAVATLHYNDRRGVEALASLQARRDARRELSAGNGALSVSIRDSGGQPLEAIVVGDRTMVVGQAGQRYSIVLTNHTRHRFESVVTVDGLDVVNGKPGSVEHRGYVLMPFATLEIEGFRQSTAAVAAFRFASVGESYAAKTGSARNVGVIGAAFFAERGDSFVDGQDLRMRDTASPFPADPRFAQPPRR